MEYLKLTCQITSDQPEILINLLMQELADRGFESFEEDPAGILLAYIPRTNFNQQVQEKLPSDILGIGKISYSTEVLKDKNWNEEWEKNFHPVMIADQCHIRAPFHPKLENIPFEIIIEPKMAFGTGHHETTSLMIEQMLQLELTGKQVLDMGCGTGVLAIMASKLGANHIVAVDIDEWAFNSTIENCKVNGITNVEAYQGDINLIENKPFDVILANINRNILLAQMSHYAASLKSGGQLLLSGIYTSDLEVITLSATKNGFGFIVSKEKNNWIAASFIKK